MKSLASFIHRSAGQAQNILSTRRLTFVATRQFASKVEKGKFEVEKDVKIYWEKHGHGPHTVLFLPGLCGSIQTNYWPVFRKMDHEKYTMIGVDPVGYGKSRPPDRDAFTEEFCLQRDARFAGDVMEHLGYDKYSLVGWSNGGISAAALGAGPRQENLISLVVCNAPIRPGERMNLVMDQIANLKHWDVKHRRDLLRIYDEDYAVKILKDWRYVAKRESEKPHHFKEILMGLSKFQKPTLFLYGTHDSFMNPVDAVDVFEEYTEFFHLRLVRNGTHFHLDFLDEFVDVVSDFLEDQEIKKVDQATV